jgi:hypothetical protein
MLYGYLNNICDRNIDNLDVGSRGYFRSFSLINIIMMEDVI